MPALEDTVFIGTKPVGGKWPVYTMEEVQRHSEADDLWMVAHGNVYNATMFVEHHPGGASALLRKGGMDVSRDFDFHRNKAFWRKFKIGVVDVKGEREVGEGGKPVNAIERQKGRVKVEMTMFVRCKRDTSTWFIHCHASDKVGVVTGKIADIQNMDPANIRLLREDEAPLSPDHTLVEQNVENANLIFVVFRKGDGWEDIDVKKPVYTS